MRLLRYAFAAFAAISLAACGLTVAEPPGPSTYADQTVIDEKAMLGLETLYQAGTQLAGTALDLGLVKTDEKRAELKALDNKAYAALQTARRAYRAGNSSSFTAAAAELSGLAEQIIALTRRKPNVADNP